VGHRCNYVVRENGARTLYYSHWGALGIVRNFFWGLDAARAFLAEQEETDDWLDDVWGEGGIALDVDERVLVVTGGDIVGEPRDLSLRLMSAIWGWDRFQVRDVESLVEIGGAVGVPRERIEAAHFALPALDVNDPKSSGREGGHLGAMILVDGAVRFCQNDRAVLELGPSGVPDLLRLPDLEEAQKIGIRESWLWIVVIDTHARRLAAASHHLRRHTSLRHYAARWPGWEFDPYRDLNEMKRRLALPDFPPAPVEPPMSIEDQLARVERHLFKQRRDPVELMKKIAAKHPTLAVNPRSMSSPGDGMPANGRDVFARAVREVLTLEAPGAADR